MAGIKYYRLAKGEELPDEFCVVRDVNGEPSEYTFYVHEAKEDKLREYITRLEQANIVLASDNCDLLNDMSDMQFFIAENAKLRDSLKALMIGMYAELCADRDEPDCEECSMHYGEDGCIAVDAMDLLGIDMDGEPLGEE